jgi:hypothetical protein
MRRRIRGVKALSFVAPVALLVLMFGLLALIARGTGRSSLNFRPARRLRS